MSAVLDTLKALPAIAGNPLAVLAYIVVIGAWLLCYMRTSRFKILMDRVAALPEADRKSAIGLEMNTVLPEHITAKEWLQGKRQFYLMIAYVLTLVSALMLVAFAFLNRGGLQVDSVGVRTSWSFLVQQAWAETPGGAVDSVSKRDDSTKHDFRFDIVLRNSSPQPVTVTGITMTFDPDEPGFLSEALQISNTYVVLLDTKGSGTVTDKTGEGEARAWYPNPDGDVLIVQSALQQTLAPLSTDRFVVEIKFPEDYHFKGPMKKARLSLTWNGSQHLEAPVSL